MRDLVGVCVCEGTCTTLCMCVCVCGLPPPTYLCKLHNLIGLVSMLCMCVCNVVSCGACVCVCVTHTHEQGVLLALVSMGCPLGHLVVCVSVDEM